MVVLVVTSSAAEPPRRTTSACASLRPSEESLPVKTTTWLLKGCSAAAGI